LAGLAIQLATAGKKKMLAEIRFLAKLINSDAVVPIRPEEMAKEERPKIPHGLKIT